MRSALTDAHEIAWQRIGEPGTWLTAEQRVAIAAETRHARSCGLCGQRKAALSPFSIDGEHDSTGELSPSMIDCAHRLTTDASRLTETWLRGLSISDAEYVEIVGVAITAIGFDTFCRAIGVPLRALPDPQPGQPSRRRPKNATDTAAWVPMRRLPGLPNVACALSLAPAEARALRELVAVEYVEPTALLDLAHDPGRSITRQQMELIAARVSALNDCFY